MGIGICTGKMGFGRWDWDLSEKKRQNGNGIGVLLAYQWDQDTGLWDLEKNGGWEMGLVTPLQDPLTIKVSIKHGLRTADRV